MNIRLLFLIILLLLSPFFLLLMHSLVVRISLTLGKEISRQKMLVACIIFLNFPVLFIALLILGDGYRNIINYLYILMTFNSFAYIYFHFFNMSETSRRIKILVSIKKGKIKSIQDIEKYYDYSKSLSIRLKRLEKMSQIESVDNNSYKLKGKLLYTVSYIIFFFRVLLGFSNIKKTNWLIVL